MEDDDLDFTPSPNTSSNLASLFGFTKKPLQGNSSLTYTAPKAPKGESTPAKKPSEEKTRGKIIFSKAVHAYLLENKAYVNQGLMGLVIHGHHDSNIHDIILYRKNKELVSQRRILNSLLITLSANNYVTFYDNNHQSWSLMFQSPADVEQFSQKIAICKFYSEPSPKEIVTQDLTPPSQHKAKQNNSVDLVYNSFAIFHDEVLKLKEDVKERVKLSTEKSGLFNKTLIGCGENSKRVIIIPHLLAGSWVSDLPQNKDLMLEVKVEKVISEAVKAAPESKAVKEGNKSLSDSGAEETTVRAKGATIKEALSSTKSQKASLISRMARMGQATLPVKPGQSDSEEDSLVASSPKPRIPRSRMAAANQYMNTSFSQTSANAEASQQKAGVVYQQLVPVSSPTSETNLSVYVSESRIQAAELRMGISKVSEKLDAIWNKMHSMGGTGSDCRVCQAAAVDTGGILTSIQNLIAENENLKKKVEDQKGKIEQQNDRIFNLLELNHKYLEQNSTTHEKQSANESKLKAEMESLKKRELELEASSKKALDRVEALVGDLAQAEGDKKELRKKLEEASAEAEALRKDIAGSQDSRRKELEGVRGELSKASDTILELEKRLREAVSESDGLKCLIKVQKEEIERGNRGMKDSESQRREYEKAVEDLKKQLSEEGIKTESKISDLSMVVARLEGDNKLLQERLEKQNNQTDLKGLLPRILSAVKDQFSDSKQYSSSDVISTVERIFKNVTDGSFDSLEKSPAEKPEVVPAPRKSLLNVAASEKDSGEPKEAKEDSEGPKEAKEDGEGPKEVKEDGEGPKEAEEKSTPKAPEGEEGVKSETDEQKKKEEADSRYKSYDQGWRTTKPPPPPLFDDEDDADDWLN